MHQQAGFFMGGTTDRQAFPRDHEEGNPQAISFVPFGNGSNTAKVRGDARQPPTGRGEDENI
jgi:hypothetical protein